MSTRRFPFPVCRLQTKNEITSYSIELLKNEVSVTCGKYDIKRKARTYDIYNSEIVINDIPIIASNTIKTFFEQVHFSLFFNIAIDGFVYNVKFTSFKITNSELYNRKNINFSVTGAMVALEDLSNNILIP